MKTSKKHVLLLVAFAAFATILVSWKNFSKPVSKAPPSLYDRMFYDNDMLGFSDVATEALQSDFWSDALDGRNAPPAEDVLVQRIKGDNYHILVMAVYSFENYSGQSVTVDYAGRNLVLRDDGQGDDKVAGDGIFTAKVDADVVDLRKQLIDLDQQMKKAGPNQYRFVDRELVRYNPATCQQQPFSLQDFDNYQATSIGVISDIIGQSNNLIDSIRNNCIFITDLSVVEDPSRTWNPCTQTGNLDGPWTFKTVMKNIAKSSSADPSDSTLSAFVLSWLRNWTVQKVINGDTVPPRPMIQEKVIQPWLDKSAAAGAPDGQLDMRFAPFKLTAIVNRFDIRERAAGIPAGEGRYTFCLIDSDCTMPLKMTMVVEFAINKKNNCDTLQAWAKQWYDLKDLTLGSPEYNTALQRITDQYTLWGTATNNSKIGLDALRTNEIEFAAEDGSPKHYEFREFGIQTDPVRKLIQRTVGQIPQDKYNAQVDNPDVRLMVAYVNANKGPIKNDAYVVPDSINGIPFLGGHSQILDTPVGFPTKPYHWDGVETRNSPARIKNTTTRHVFSRNTCTGCHAGEIQTFFTHVDPVFFGTEATLSGFLSGRAGRGGAVDADGNPDNDSMMVFDAAGRGGLKNNIRLFNDILRRAKDLKDFVLTPPCANGILSLRNQLMFRPLVGSVH